MLIVDVPMLENGVSVQLQVYERADDRYDVVVDGALRYADCSAHDVICGMGSCIQQQNYDAAWKPEIDPLDEGDNLGESPDY